MAAPKSWGPVAAGEEWAETVVLVSEWVIRLVADTAAAAVWVETVEDPMAGSPSVAAAGSGETAEMGRTQILCKTTTLISVEAVAGLMRFYGSRRCRGRPATVLTILEVAEQVRVAVGLPERDQAPGWMGISPVMGVLPFFLGA